jgi:hypothetical protein
MNYTEKKLPRFRNNLKPGDQISAGEWNALASLINGIKAFDGIWIKAGPNGLHIGGKVATGAALTDGWHVRQEVVTEDDATTVSLHVKPGLRTVIGGYNSEEPAAITIDLAGRNLVTGGYVVKQYSNLKHAWIQGATFIPAADPATPDVDAPSVSDVINPAIPAEGPGDEIGYIRVTPEWDIDFENGSASITADVDWRLWPNTLMRQVRILAYVSPITGSIESPESYGTVTQFAHGTIYAIDNTPGDAPPEEDVPLEDVEQAEEDDCDQNDHPGSGDYDDSDPDLPHEMEEWGGDWTEPDPYGRTRGGTYDPDKHPGEDDCFTTR